MFKSTVSLILLVFMCQAKQLEPTTKKIIQNYVRQKDISIFDKQNERFKIFVDQHITESNIENYPDFFLYRMWVNENRINYNKYLPVLISITDYPRREYSSIKNDANAFNIVDSSNFSSLGTYLDNDRHISITNTNIIISKNLKHLIKILSSYSTSAPSRFI